MLTIKQILMERDGLSEMKAVAIIDEMRKRVSSGEADPEELLMDELGLEADYVMELL